MNTLTCGMAVEYVVYAITVIPALTFRCNDFLNCAVQLWSYGCAMFSGYTLRRCMCQLNIQVWNLNLTWTYLLAYQSQLKNGNSHTDERRLTKSVLALLYGKWYLMLCFVSVNMNIDYQLKLRSIQVKIHYLVTFNYWTLIYYNNLEIRQPS